MKINHIYINCLDVKKVIPFECCDSCHSDFMEGYSSEQEETPKDNNNGKSSSIIALTCCSYPDNISRKDYAKILKIKRKKES